MGIRLCVCAPCGVVTRPLGFCKGIGTALRVRIMCSNATVSTVSVRTQASEGPFRASAGVRLNIVALLI